MSSASQAMLNAEEVYVFGSKHRLKGVMFEAELAALIKHRAISQITVTVTEAGYWVAVLPNERAEFVTRQGEKVARFKPITQKDFVVLHSVRRNQVKYFKTLDTFVRGIMRFGALPKLMVCSGKAVR